MSLPHHLVVCVDEVSAPVTVSPCVQAGQVRQEPLGVVDGHLSLAVGASRYDDSLLQLDTAGVPDNEMILVCIYTSPPSTPSKLTLESLVTLHCNTFNIANVVTYIALRATMVQ